MNLWHENDLRLNDMNTIIEGETLLRGETGKQTLRSP